MAFRSITAGSARSATRSRRCTGGSTSSTRYSRCTPIGPTWCSTGGTSPAGRELSARRSRCSPFPAPGTTSSARRSASARRCSASSSLGRNEPQRCQRSERPRHIGGGEHPFRRVVVKQAPYPAADEGLRPHAAAHQVLPDRKRTDDAEQRLEGDIGDRCEMEVAQPGIADPCPTERGADPYGGEAADDEDDDREMI